MKSQGRVHLLTVPRAAQVLCALIIVATSLFLYLTAPARAASFCQVTYTVTNQWTGGFGANLAIQNTSSSAWTSWTLTFAFPASGQTVTQGWNGTFSQSGQNVTVTNASYNASVAASASVNPGPGFNGVWTTSNPVPTSFSVNGNACGTSVIPTATSTSVTTTPTPGTPTSTPPPGNLLKANQVVWIGDSWIQIPGDQHNRVRDLARAAGDIGQNEDFVDLAVSGSPIATIVNQYTTQEAGSVKVKLLLMDGGGIDTIEGGGSQSSVTHVVNTFTQFLTQVKSDGTVQAVVYFLYPQLSTIAGVAALRPVMSQACAASPVPCFFLDLQPLFAGHPEYIGPDGIHPNSTGAVVIGNALWNIIQTNNLMQLH